VNRKKKWILPMLAFATAVVCCIIRGAGDTVAERTVGNQIEAADATRIRETETEVEAYIEITAEEKPRIALTFDDGPHPVYTEKLLDGLKERQVNATFFVVGENIEGREEILKRMDQEGHLIGNHTYDHVKLTGVSGEEAAAQIKKTSDLIFQVTGKETVYIRPPFGEWEKELEGTLVLFPVLWTIDPLDWTTKNTDLVVERVRAEAAEDGIILLHDCYESSVDAALRIVDLLQGEGYEFVTVDRLILE
jgi:peptidoglycan/xylan/chitin deacetylase (PgdA/CDA1 family)